jgi:dTDP-4-dehydrorhamnose 3,5-epimerase
MIFTTATLPGVWRISPRRFEDERGYFARTYCVREFTEHGLDPQLVQHSLSHNHRCGTLRGMHFQKPPHAENKMVTCSRGEIYDVVLDLRTGSQTFGKWEAFTLSADNGEAVFIPAGCAHGFITLADETTVRYDISAYHVPEAARGVRFDDPAFGIVWPMDPVVISPRDLAYPSFTATKG